MPERAAARPGDGEILLRGRAAGVDAADRLARSGAAPLCGEPPFSLGRDVSGVVAETGAGVALFRPGDEVFGMVGSGGHAVHVTAPAGHFAVKPAGLDHVHAAAGAVGHVAVRLAEAEGAYVIGTADFTESVHSIDAALDLVGATTVCCR
ncbi:alcohol dehydrogenase catalytic domain-containing protein [Streptomyces sp. NPDC005760]|uniref:alcohol dehydrogenase catalytic domain-containing protein n=1 Tax=Streptomyces sp. NPDC005760 TaxID=3156718 RepID=UPI0033FAA753